MGHFFRAWKDRQDLDVWRWGEGGRISLGERKLIINAHLPIQQIIYWTFTMC